VFRFAYMPATLLETPAVVFENRAQDSCSSKRATSRWTIVPSSICHSSASWSLLSCDETVSALVERLHVRQAPHIVNKACETRRRVAPSPDESQRQRHAQIDYRHDHRVPDCPRATRAARAAASLTC